MRRETKTIDELGGMATILALWFVVWTVAFVASPFLASRLPCVWEIFEGAGRAAYAVGLAFFIVVKLLQIFRKAAAQQSEAGKK